MDIKAFRKIIIAKDLLELWIINIVEKLYVNSYSFILSLSRMEIPIPKLASKVWSSLMI